MNRRESLKDNESKRIFDKLQKLHKELDDAFLDQYERSLPFNEELFDRWERAEKLSFGKNTSVYDSALIFGNPKVGNNCWIGPYTIIDGSGGLEIGDFCTVSSGVHIYTHDNIKQTLTSGQAPIERDPVRIGQNVYIGPNAVITKGISIGSYCVIGAYAMVNSDIPDYSIVFGQPARIRGNILINGSEISFTYL